MVVVWRTAYRQLGERTVPVRVVAVLVAVVAVGSSALWRSSSQAARTTVVGAVDVFGLMQELLADPIQQETERLQKEFDEKSKGLKDEERQRLFNQYQLLLERRSRELESAQLARVREAIGAVAEEQKLDLVLDSRAVWWGAQDITPQVAAKLGVRLGSGPQGGSSGSGSGSSSTGGAPAGQGTRGSGR